MDRALRAAAPDAPGIALVALGGYGRRELAPRSDVDLLILVGPRAARGLPAEEFASTVLYPLWDAGLEVGHAVRTVQECREEAAGAVESLTALLDARPVAGDETLLRRAGAEVAAIVRADPAGFLDELRASRVRREARFGITGEDLEPDLRDGVGGLRDVAMAGWVARGLLGAGTGSLVARGWLREREARRLDAALEALLLARTALHRAAGSRSNRLLRDHQLPVAEALGAAGSRGWEPVDALMRTVFDHARRVQAAVDGCLARAGAEVAPGGPRGDQVLDLDPDRPPLEAAVEAAARLAEQGGRLASGALDRMEDGAALATAGPWPDAAGRDVVRILAAGEGGVRALRVLELTGWLARLLPEWEDVRGRPQRDPYHRFPVDVHLVRAAAHVAGLLYRPGEPFAARAVGALDDLAPVLVGALLHDIGKAGLGSHVPAGVQRAGAAVARMGLSDDQREAVAFLVAEHLLLSETATRRDLEDESLVLQVAARVGDPQRLAMLYLLTMADAACTGPTAATPWRLGLIRDLTARVEGVFARGEMDRDRAERIAAAAAAAETALMEHPAPRVRAFLSALPPGYLLWADPADAPAHLALVEPRPGWLEVRTHHRPGEAAGVHLLAVGALDRPGLLANVAGALSLAGLRVLSAQAFTTERGVALDAFEVAGAYEEEVSEDRWRRFRRTLRHALEARVDVGDRIAALRAHYRAAADVPVAVRVDRETSDSFTVVEVEAADRLGLLFDLARTLADRGLDVHFAKVGTYGPRVVDVFYVSGRRGEPLEDPAEVSRLADALRAAAAGDLSRGEPSDGAPGGEVPAGEG